MNELLENNEIILSRYQKNKAAIYKWRNNNKEIYSLKKSQYSIKKYELNREEILKNIKETKIKKDIENNVIKRRVGRPSKYNSVVV